MRFPVFSCAIIVYALVTGCAPSLLLPPDLRLPADWKNAAHFPVASSSQDLSRWWTKFGDSTLNQVIAEGLRNSPDIASASARIRESRANREAQTAGLFPMLNGSADAGYSNSRTNGVSIDSRRYSTGLSASWEIDLFGKQRSAIQAASATLGATEENFHSVQASLASEIALSYVSLRSLEARLAVVRTGLKSREETYNLAKVRLQAGIIDSLESDQALTSLQQSRAAIPSLEQSIVQTRNRLSLLVGKNPGTLDSLLARGKAIPVPPRSLALGIPADSIRRRPDVRVAGYQLLAQAANTNVAEAARFPSLSISGSLGLNTISTGKIFNPETATGSLAAGITSPIFDAGRIRANIDAQRAVEQQAVQTYRSVVLTALSEVEDALIACRKTGEAQEILQQAVASARDADTLARQRYQAGVTDILTVLDAQRALLSLQETLISSQADRSSAFIQLYKALGGGWSPQS